MVYLSESEYTSILVSFPSPLTTASTVSPHVYNPANVLPQHCLIQLRRVMSANAEDHLDEKDYRTMFHELLTSEVLPTSKKAEDRIHDEVQTTVAAGTETVARAMRVITYHLCSNPHILHRLREELFALPEFPDGRMKWHNLEKPYLIAIIMEGLRLSYGTATRLARIAPDRILEYGDWKIPPGTPASMTNLLIFQNEDVFPKTVFCA